MSEGGAGVHKDWYERSVQAITEFVKPHLHHVSQRFVQRAIDEHAKDNPKFARIIEFEVRRRGDGAGLTQDVAEPLLWTGVKTAAALTIAVLTRSIENGKFKLIGYGAALGVVLNNAVELLRLVPRYKAGLQGSLEMAKDRWRSIEETGVDPFDAQSREINPEIKRIKSANVQKADNGQEWQAKVVEKDTRSRGRDV